MFAGEIPTALVCTFIFLFQLVKFSISGSPGDLYINGLVQTGDGQIMLYNGGSLSIQATNSNYMCILLMTNNDDWAGAAPECKYTTGTTEELYCEVGDKYTYSQGLEPTFTPSSQVGSLRLKVQACAYSRSDTHGNVLTFDVYTPVMKNAHCIPNKPLTVRLPLTEYGSNNINHFGAKKVNTFSETYDQADGADGNSPYDCDGVKYIWECKGTTKKGCFATAHNSGPAEYQVRSKLIPANPYGLPVYAFGRFQEPGAVSSDGVDAIVGSMGWGCSINADQYASDVPVPSKLLYYKRPAAGDMATYKIIYEDNEWEAPGNTGQRHSAGSAHPPIPPATLDPMRSNKITLSLKAGQLGQSVATLTTGPVADIATTSLSPSLSISPTAKLGWYTCFAKHCASFEIKYYFHMSLLPTMIFVMSLAYIVVLCCCLKKTTRTNALGEYIKYLLILVFLLYPGMTAKIFQIFDCRRFDTKGYLRADYKYECCTTWNILTNTCDDEPTNYQILRWTAVFFMIIYAFGIPLAAFLTLRRNRASLHDEKHRDYQQTLHRYGGLYETYDTECWYWETVELLRKMILTGFMIILVPGSSAQILIGLLICLFYLLLIIKYAPFADPNEDRLGMFASLQLLLMLIGAFALKTDDKDNGTYDGIVVAVLLMAMNICVFILGFWTIAYAFPNVKITVDKCLQCSCCFKLKKNEEGKPSITVAAIAEPPPGTEMNSTNGGKNKHKIKDIIVDESCDISALLQEEAVGDLVEFDGKNKYKISSSVINK